MIRPRFVVSLLAILAVSSAFIIQCQTPAPAAKKFVAYSSPGLTDKVNWRNWEDSTFAEAQSVNKPILLFLSAAWCGQCTRMEQEVLANDKIAAEIRNNYLPIKIDADRYPDIYDRYHLGGYPSCVILTPDARIIGGGNNLPVDSLRLLLTMIDKYWKDNRAVVLGQADKLQKLFVQAATSSKPQKPSDVAIALADQVVTRQYDSTYGGFGTQPKFPLPDVYEFMFTATGPQGGLLFKNEIMKTFNAQLALLDTTWGGFYRYAAFADWSGASHEKLLDGNAKLLSNYLDAYLISNDEEYKHAAELTVGYLDRFLRSGDGWGFYNSQQGEVISAGAIDPQQYFALSDEGRLRHGVPRVDSSMYTDANCTAVRAYFKAMRVIGRQEYGEYASKTLDQILVKAKGESSGLYHDLLRPSQSEFGLLPDQIACIQALLDGYETLGNKDYLARARDIANFVIKYLADPDSGGVHYEVSVAGFPGRMSVPLKPYNYNCDAVVAFVRLYHLTADEAYKNLAVGIVNYLFNTPIREDDLRLCKLAMAHLWNSRVPLTFVVVGKPDDTRRSLLRSFWKTYFSREIVLQFEPGVDNSVLKDMNFPATDQPSLYVCIDSLRSPAIVDTATVADKIKEFLRGK